MVGAEQDDEPTPGWSVRLNEVQRLDREEGDEGDWFFSVEFELSGLGVSGTLAALVTDPANEETIIAEAIDMLLVGLGEYAEVVRQKLSIARDLSVPAGDERGAIDGTRQVADAPANKLATGQGGQRRKPPADAWPTD